MGKAESYVCLGVGTMYLDSLGGIGVTADSHKVKPGMIYVDLSGRRNIKELYKAYGNGAYLIFTPHNISDPNLPVIKVNNPHDTLSMLIQHFLTRPEIRTSLIAVIGNGNKDVILELIESILYDRAISRKAEIRYDGPARYNGMAEIESMLERLSSASAGGGDIIPVALDTNPRILSYYNDFKFDCAIINDAGILDYSQENLINVKLVNEFLLKVLEGKTIIINNDEPFVMRAVELGREITPITCGLNKKAAVTASSIDIGEITRFNYCVQRSFRTKSGKLIEPFEMPLSINAIGSHIIYNALAAITCGLYYDADIEKIKSAVERYKVPERHFEKIYSNRFTVIDNYCNSPLDFKAVFELLQIMNYKNLYLIISINQNSGIHAEGAKAAVISEWAKILKCKNISITSCMDGGADIQEFPLRNIRIYKKIFKDKDIPFRYYHLLQHAAEHALRHIQKGDLLVFLGGNEISKSKELIKAYMGTTQ